MKGQWAVIDNTTERKPDTQDSSKDKDDDFFNDYKKLNQKGDRDDQYTTNG